MYCIQQGVHALTIQLGLFQSVEVFNNQPYLLHCKPQTAFPASLCPESGSAAPGWRDRTGPPSPFFHLSLCLFLCLALSPAHTSVAAGGGPRAGGPWQSQQQPNNGEQRDTEEELDAGENLPGRKCHEKSNNLLCSVTFSM